MIDEKGANEIFKLEHFNRCLTQDGIDAYNNEKLGIIAIAQGIEQKKESIKLLMNLSKKKIGKLKNNVKVEKNLRR